MAAADPGADANAGAGEHTPTGGERRVVGLQDARNELTHLVRVLGVRQEVPVAGPLQLRIAQIARLQRGYVARRQLLVAGVASSTIAWLVERQRLFEARRCVYIVGHDATPALGDETSALLALREGAALSHETAAALWGLASATPSIHVVIRGGPGTSPRGVTVHRSRCLKATDIGVRHRLPVTSVARTLLDYADGHTERQVELAFDHAKVDRVLRRHELDGLLRRTSGRRGAPLLRDLLDAQGTTTVTRSEAEERLLTLIRAAQLPAPRINARLLGYEVDFYWPEQRFVVEVDGYRFHSGSRAFEHDRRKDSALVTAGIATIRVTWRQLEREPYAVVARIAQGISRLAQPPMNGAP
jgi:very-short-patch-repair endonuclease